MATKVYDTFQLELEDGSTITLKPLAIKPLRKFMDILKKMDDEGVDESNAMDVFIEASVLCIRSLGGEKYAEMSDEDIEDLLTVPTVLKILEVAGGLKSADPNLLGATLVGQN